jgi:hypothetical protein
LTFSGIGFRYEGRAGPADDGAWPALARTAIRIWPPYTAERRATMQFDVNSRIVDDPNAEIRKILETDRPACGVAENQRVRVSPRGAGTPRAALPLLKRGRAALA